MCVPSPGLLAIPNIESDGRLGSWSGFLQSMGYPSTNNFNVVYLDTDRLSAGVITLPSGSNQGMNWGLLNYPRTELRQNVGRLVAQANGPDIVVYDFTEIISGLPSLSLPRNLAILGQRPAAIVCQGMIGRYQSSATQLEDYFLAESLSIAALNSCDPDNPLATRWPGTSPGGDGITQSKLVSGQLVQWSGGGGDGGYGGAGSSGGSDTQYGVTAEGGAGGPANFSWDVLQPGSPGGSSLETAGNYYRGGQGGGAVLLKANGPIAIDAIFASGGIGELRGGDGSGGHVVLESAATVRVRVVSLDSSNGGGGGVIEFRKTPKVLGSSSTINTGPEIFTGSTGRPQSILGVVGIPQGLAFPPSGSVFSEAVYKTNSRPDSSVPLITVNGSRIRNVTEGSSYSDAGASAVDNLDGALAVTTIGSVNTSIPGPYEISYTAVDASGNTAIKKRYVNVFPAQPAARDPQTGLPNLVAAGLRPINPSSATIDAKLLPSFEFSVVDGLQYPAVTFLRRMRDFMPLGSYPDSMLDRELLLQPPGLRYSFRTSTSLTSSWSGSLTTLSQHTFVQRSNVRNGVVAPNGCEFVTYRINTPVGSSPPAFYRVAITTDPLN